MNKIRGALPIDVLVDIPISPLEKSQAYTLTALEETHLFIRNGMMPQESEGLSSLLTSLEDLYTASGFPRGGSLYRAHCELTRQVEAAIEAATRHEQREQQQQRLQQKEQDLEQTTSYLTLQLGVWVGTPLLLAVAAFYLIK